MFTLAAIIVPVSPPSSLRTLPRSRDGIPSHTLLKSKSEASSPPWPLHLRLWFLLLGSLQSQSLQARPIAFKVFTSGVTSIGWTCTLAPLSSVTSLRPVVHLWRTFVLLSLMPFMILTYKVPMRTLRICGSSFSSWICFSFLRLPPARAAKASTRRNRWPPSRAVSELPGKVSGFCSWRRRSSERLTRRDLPLLPR